MASKKCGVVKLIHNRDTKALFFHCASQRLNLIINDLNKIIIIRDTKGIIKRILKIFREITLRRKFKLNILNFWEPHWSSKYKSIRLFPEKCISIIQSLQSLSINGLINTYTR